MNRQSQNRESEVLFVGNQKGGVGKTTNCVHIAAALASLGRKCLVWDLDANQGATLHLGVDGDAYVGSLEVLMGEEDPSDVIITGEEDGVDLPRNLHLIPAGGNLEKITTARPGLRTRDLLLDPLSALRGHYDYIFLDTAPNLTVPTVAAYKSATWFILSAVPDPFAIVGLKNALAHIRSAVKQGNRRARLLGVLFSCVESRILSRDRVRMDRSLLKYVDEKLTTRKGQSLKFETTISSTVAIPECQMQGKTLFQTQPKHKVVSQYRQLAREIETRLEAFSTTAP